MKWFLLKSDLINELLILRGQKMKKKILIFLCMSLFILAGCADPTEKELTKGQKIDIERMQGTVVSKSIRYFEGDRGKTTERKGKPYYCLEISFVEGSLAKKEEFKDVPIEVFDAVNVGTILPVARLLTLTQLAKMQGEIVDMQANLASRKFSIVVKNLDGINVYAIDIKTYYELLHIGTKLPVSVEKIK